MTADISRHSLRPAQGFTGVVRQQGRLPIDADETESDDIAALMLRSMVAETICTRGSPDDGFRIANAVLQNGLLDFDIAAGGFYLGGTRVASDGDRFSDQPDWLTVDQDDARDFTLPAGNATRTDLIWLSGWEQTVTATEDGELLEPALGGPDTTARRRLMWRVGRLEDVPPSCADAFADLVDRAFPGGALAPGEADIVSDARLTVGFTQLQPLDDLCRPAAQAGFLGARNEAFRVQLSAPGRFVWGRDNAAPLYRVQLGAETGQPGQLRRPIAFLKPPRDEFGWPLAGMTVELLRWGSLLANREKAAEPTGMLLRVTSGFDPDGDRIEVEAGQALTDLIADWAAWRASAAGQAAGQPLDEVSAEDFFFLRVWTGGGAGAALDHSMNVGGGPVDLGETGLTLDFAAAGIAGDYWVVSARPNTPARVMPWALLDDAAPAGPRRVVAPLALIASTGQGVGEPIDCRHRFRPLCEVGACCRVTVGDGRSSFGDTDSIQDAIGRLPAEGGEICIHPGDYAEHVVIAGRRDIVITGCGAATRWGAEPGREAPLLSIESSDNILVRRIAMTNPAGEAILADVPAATGAAPSRRLTAEDLGLVIADRPAILINGGDAHSVRRCRINLEPMSQGFGDDPDIGRGAAIFLAGRDLLVEHSRITARDELAERFGALAVGGIHIGGGSRHVMIRENLISGGSGHGITLGSVQFVPAGANGVVGLAGLDYYRDFIRRNRSEASGYGSGAIGHFGLGIGLNDTGCPEDDGTPTDPGGDPDDPLFPESAGAVRDVRIRNNDIIGMGYNGISAHVFSGLGRDGRGDAIAVEHIEIDNNRIAGCMRGEVGTLSPLQRLFTGWGGIALSICSDASIRDNLITGNGRRSREAICGVFIAIGEDVRIERNRIDGNGIAGDDRPLAPGLRGGIVIGLAEGGVPGPSARLLLGDDRARGPDFPALLVAGNIVDAPNSRALRAMLIGPGMVHGNRLAGAGQSALFSRPTQALAGALVGFLISGDDIIDPRETIDLQDYAAILAITDLMGGDAVNLINLCVAEDIAAVRDGDRAAGQRLRGGETMFNDNQVSLRRHSRESAVTVSSVFVASEDDVSLCDNQLEVENDVRLFLTDALVFGATIRVEDNRAQERLGGGILSIVDYGFLNNTSNNQTTHCILAAGLPQGRVVVGNRSIFDLVGAGQRICAIFEGLADGQSAGIGTAAGVKAIVPENHP